MYVNNQKEMFIDGIWLGGKLLRAITADDGSITLMWGNSTVNLTSPSETLP